MTMDHETLRLECMKLAREEGLSGKDVIARAQEIFDFLRYGADSATEARKLVAGAPIARAVGKDGEFEKPFKDYLRSEDK